ncbi:Calcineurin-like phosphoesterase [Deinococcus reticulitermitis]|uniref:Calcineurin-like phosphoesterase n=1 Tax=Deinococcus reticulitermitis TaxID=856736 RepID=A0A1H6XNM0_9DEIO|nr:metallophosphoesterase [Deinococcus reticulitermitis]SEJ28367.1 Calcineurin-like phosphoesterase [Deinococcus reticulitermitis]
MSAGTSGRSRARPLWVVGDVHGALPKLKTLLRGAELLGAQDEWTGGDAHLAFLGDYLDRGPDGLGVVRLVRALEAQAPQSGGQVTALLGNHEVMFLAAARFGPRHPSDPLGLHEYWLGNGGRPQDLGGLTPEDEAWLLARPALARAGPWLFAHADSLFYLDLGGNVEEVNRALAERLGSPDPEVWAALANAFVDRLNFVRAGGAEQAQRLLTACGGRRLVHGHSPVPLLLREGGPALSGDPDLPLLYAGGLCLGVDSAMAYLRHAGFIARLGEATAEEVVMIAPQLARRG